MAQADKIDTDRPDQTESVVTVPKNWLQIETGLLLQKNSIEEREYLLPTALTKFGLTKTFELRLISTLKKIRLPASAYSCLEPIEIGGKINLLEEVDT